MKRVWVAGWVVVLLFALLCDPVTSKGGRGGARGSARGTARGGRGRTSVRSSPVRVAGAAAAGAAVALAAGGWYASAQKRPDDSSERDDQYANRTEWDFYRTSDSAPSGCLLTKVWSVLLSINTLAYAHL
ncbi:shadow of prion protein [Alosa alosa]|nr:shadow of prion protein isoform X3 [Alosa sapidissima]XP_041922280.1 shadow of prion protein isoform X3 [Alosa sapidissima]XP_041922281.1 shadow of prion protein isoform X3 [Alosa sapidissima]XP_048125376.1 shadow of prion protein [Alosa alosa]